MAQVPTLEQPSVAQQVGPVGPQQVDSQAANPLMAGAQATGDLAQHAMAIQGTMNQLAANDSSNAVLPQLDKIVSDYATNSKGVFASANAPDALNALQTTFAQGKQGLSLDAQIAYDQVAHRAYGYAVSAIQRHVTTQTNEAIVSSSKASIENNAGLGTMALLAGDETGLHAAIGEIAKQTAFMQTGAGLGTGESIGPPQVGGCRQTRDPLPENTGHHHTRPGGRRDHPRASDADDLRHQAQ